MEMMIDLLNCSEVEIIKLFNVGVLDDYLNKFLVKALTNAGFSEVQIDRATEELQKVFESAEYPTAMELEKSL